MFLWLPYYGRLNQSPQQEPSGCAAAGCCAGAWKAVAGAVFC